ncbi:MAG: hypothetical protein ABR543_11680 [Gemmatimonadaceae bacterium]
MQKHGDTEALGATEGGRAPSQSDGLNRRSFVELAGFGAIGVVSGELASARFAADGQPGADWSDALGRGFLSTGQQKALMASLKESMPGRENNATISFALEVVTTRSSYAKSVAGSARAKFGSGPFSVKGSVSSSEDFRSQRTTVHLVLTKRVTTHDEFLRDPVMSSAARREASPLFLGSPLAFVNRFGDHMIRKVTLGGDLTLVYTLQYEREAQASNFRGQVAGKWKGGGGAADLHRTIRSESQAASIALRGYCRGVKTMPSLIRDAKEAKAAAASAPELTEITELLSFWDRFDEMVRDDGVPVLVDVQSMPVHEIRNAPSSMRGKNLVAINRILTQCDELDDLIDTRLAELRYLKEKCLAWNTHVPVASIDERLGELTTQASTLRDFVRRLSEMKSVTTFDQAITLPFQPSDVRRIPDSWLCRDLRQLVTRGWTRFKDGPISMSLPLPTLYEGQHVQMLGRITKYGSDPASCSLKFDNSPVLAEFSGLTNSSRAIDQIAQVTKGATRVDLTGVTYGEDPCDVTLSLWG